MMFPFVGCFGRLAFAGYTVCEAGDGYSALHVLEGAERVDLVVLDRAVPTMSGHIVRAEIEARSPATPIIVVTGSASDTLSLDVALVIRKPITADQLAMAVRRVLGTA
jgi:CheY-like chemotaxis protein